MDGDPETVYNVTLRFRGVVEFRSYVGGTRTGRIQQAGYKDPTNAGGAMSELRNMYRLEIEDPADYYFLNAWDTVESIITGTVAFDQQITVPIRGGSWVRTAGYVDYEYATDVPSGTYTAGQAKNQDGTGANPRSVGGSGVLVSEPFDGQWIQMDVVSIT
jgi:hypothetical protein